MAETNSEEILARLEPLLTRSPGDEQAVVFMTCGLAGAGKSTLSKAILSRFPQYERLSIDEIIFRNHGIYGVDYPADEGIYEKYLDEADEIYMREFQTLLKNRRDIILDRSFYAKEDRKEFYSMIEASGARRVFVYLKARDKEKLWDRICARSAKGKEANSAFDISRATLDRYWNGFEEPVGEDEIVVNAV